MRVCSTLFVLGFCLLPFSALEAAAPLQWDLASGSGIAWQVDIERPAGAGPLRVGDLVIAMEEPATLRAYQAATGQPVWQASASFLDLLPEAQRSEAERLLLAVVDGWQRDLGPKAGGLLQQQRDSLKKKYRIPYLANYKYIHYGYAYSAPVTDGTNIYVRNGTEVVAAFDQQGKRLWLVKASNSAKQTCLASGLLCVDGVLIYKIPAGAADEPKGKKGKRQKGFQLTALACADGKRLWTSKVFPGAGHGEWGHQALATIGERRVLATPDGHLFDPMDGRCLGHISGTKAGWGLSPHAAGDIIVYENKVVRLRLSGDGVQAEIVAELDKKGKLFNPAASHAGKAYSLQDRSCRIIDLQTGSVSEQRLGLPAELIQRRQTIAKMKRKPALCRTQIVNGIGYVSIDGGDFLVFQVEPQFKLLHCNRLPLLKGNALVCIDDDRLFARTTQGLICIK